MEDDILTVAQMKVTLLNKKSGSDFDTYRMAIQKPNSVSEDNYVQHCLAADMPCSYIPINTYYVTAITDSYDCNDYLISNCLVTLHVCICIHK